MIYREKESASGRITIRKAEVADIPVILELIKEIAAFEKLENEVVATEESLAESLFGKVSAAEVLFASVDDKVSGYAVFFHNYSTFLGSRGMYLEDIYIRPEQRNAGLGKLLFETVAGIAVERGCGRMEWAVLNWNKSAIGFYERLGAEPLSEWTLFRLPGKALKEISSGDCRVSEK